jgi:hypothetical protein
MGTTALAGCQGPVTEATVVSDAQIAANDIAAALALGVVPQPAAGILSLAVSGFQALLAQLAGSLATGATTFATVVGGLTSALKSAVADVPPASAAATALNAAIAALGTLTASSSQTVQQQVEAAVAEGLIAYLTLKAPASAERGAAAGSFGALVDDANGHVQKLKGQ